MKYMTGSVYGYYRWSHTSQRGAERPAAALGRPRVFVFSGKGL